MAAAHPVPGNPARDRTDLCHRRPARHPGRDAEPAAKGQGLNSIPIRFALLAAACTGLCILVLVQLVLPLRDTLSAGEFCAVLLLTITVPALVTYGAASKLTSAILALRRSTAAIVRGDFNRPVDVDCACEVGGLADSFRAMIERLNSNMLRMNVLAFTDPVTRVQGFLFARPMLAAKIDAWPRARARGPRGVRRFRRRPAAQPAPSPPPRAPRAG
ncbi:HAMP domain-containing protein [Neoroseomonas rubea]|uniref:HAMP domain-containing protein n=1 Tax=Neoroseomonas rubea TaxID=2748666 RepID=UPI0018E004E1|nr:HAMP domain-containing protein [Roseomonas rubea]